MLEIHQRLGSETHNDIDDVVCLTHEQRERGRLRLTGQTGDEIRVFLERGKPLQVGEYLRSDCGKTVLVQGAVEPVVTATAPDWETFAKACYHLGNRHVKVQIGPLWLRIQPDHVLEDLLLLLGLGLNAGQAVFVPESGAYAGLASAHHHSHGESHSHAHA